MRGRYINYTTVYWNNKNIKEQEDFTGTSTEYFSNHDELPYVFDLRCT